MLTFKKCIRQFTIIQYTENIYVFGNTNSKVITGKIAILLFLICFVIEHLPVSFIRKAISCKALSLNIDVIERLPIKCLKRVFNLKSQLHYTRFIAIQTFFLSVLLYTVKWFHIGSNSIHAQKNKTVCVLYKWLFKFLNYTAENMYQIHECSRLYTENF